jgi:polyisoprenoid-binding protein YceI
MSQHFARVHGVFDHVKSEADSVDTGGSFQDDKLKSEDFFNVKQNPYVTGFVAMTVVSFPFPC